MKNIMIRIAVAAVMVAETPAAQSPERFDEDAYFRFAHKMGIFHRELMGCPLEGYPPAIECTGGKFDAKLWLELVAESREVFPQANNK